MGSGQAMRDLQQEGILTKGASVTLTDTRNERGKMKMMLIALL